MPLALVGYEIIIAYSALRAFPAYFVKRTIHLIEEHGHQFDYVILFFTRHQKTFTNKIGSFKEV